MIYRESTPSMDLSGVIERFWSIEYQGSTDAPLEPVLPDGCPEVIFNLGDRFQRVRTKGDTETQASAIVSGQIRSRLLIRPTGNVSLFGVRFRPHGAAGFLNVAMSSLTDQVIPLSDVVGAASDELESRIAEAGTLEGRIAVVEVGIRARSIDGDTALAAALTEMISESGGRMRVKELAESTGISERRVERIFDRHVGISPKVFSRIVRFRGVVRSIESADSFGLLDAALSRGYYDQSHMIHDFNEFAGTSPRGYFDQTHRLSELFTS